MPSVIPFLFFFKEKKNDRKIVLSNPFFRIKKKRFSDLINIIIKKFQ